LNLGMGGELEIGAKANHQGSPSVTLGYQNNEITIRE